MDKIKISSLDTHKEYLWDEYVRTKQDSTIYHLSAWRKLIETIFGHDTYYLYAHNQESVVVGVLPLVRQKSLIFGDFAVSLPFFNYGGVLAETDEIEQLLMNQACNIGKEIGVSHIEFRDSKHRNDGWQVRRDKVAMILDLPETEDEMWKTLGSKRRSQIKRPLRESIEIIEGGLELVDDFYYVFTRGMRDLGTPVYPRKLFKEIIKLFPDECFIVVIKHKGIPVAAGFLIGYNNKLEIPWAATLNTVKSIGVGMLLYWEIIKRAISKHYRNFDFGRSSVNSGTYKFKKQWGAVEKQLYWHYWLSPGTSMPKLSPDNAKYKMAIQVWKRLPLTITNAIGPSIVKYLP